MNFICVSLWRGPARLLRCIVLSSSMYKDLPATCKWSWVSLGYCTVSSHQSTDHSLSLQLNYCWIWCITHHSYMNKWTRSINKCEPTVSVIDSHWMWQKSANQKEKNQHLLDKSLWHFHLIFSVQLHNVVPICNKVIKYKHHAFS